MLTHTFFSCTPIRIFQSKLGLSWLEPPQILEDSQYRLNLKRSVFELKTVLLKKLPETAQLLLAVIGAASDSALNTFLLVHLLL